MGFPHPTVDVPGEWPAIRDELAMLDDSLARELRDALNGVAASSASGHVCATAWVIDPTGQYTLLVLHPDLGWSTPGGHVERHELTRGAALRELEEETGLTRFDVRPLEDRPSFVHVTDREGERPHRHWNVAWTFVADMDAPLSPIESARWWPIDALPDGPADLIEKTTVLVRLLAGA
jgi:8-oxo-dGTP diphosphatase